MTLEKDDNTEGLHSSEPADDVTEGDAVNTAEASGAAEPSTATGEESEGLLSVVRDVIKPSDDSDSPTENKAPDADPVTGKAEEKEPDDTDYSDVPFNKHPRFQQLLRKTKAFEEDAGRYRNIETFLSENNLEADEAADGLRIMALAKSDPRKALEELKPWVQKLLQASGEVLPDDLRTRVQSGELPPEVAKEISQTRAQMANDTARREREDQRRQQDEAGRHAASLRDAALTWASDRDTKDPAFQEKYPALQREIAFLQRSEGIPATIEGVRDQLNRAYSEVNKQARAAAPQARPLRQPTRPLTGGAAPGTHSPAPTSMLEAVQAARQG